jgi:hypothetical protein
MGQTLYLQIVGAVIAANLVTLIFVYGIWMAKQDEKRGGGGWQMPAWAYLLLCIAPAFAAWSAWFSTTQ